METTKGNALVLRTCKADMTSRNRFVWPVSGPVECPDWIASNDCGNGLHGALWGQGDGRLFDWNPEAVWQVVQIDEWIDLSGKVKFPRGIVVHTGNQESATKYIIENGTGGGVIGSVVTAGNRGTATAGYYGTATAGNRGTATAGYYGTATAGDYGTATAGNHGTAIAGYHGTATAGNDGTATAGVCGTATAGYHGTATAGDCGTATAGDCGILQLKYYDEKSARYRIKMGYVGEDGIEPNVSYRLDDNRNFVKAVDTNPESV